MNVCGYYQIRSDIADEMVNEEKECETYTHRYKEVGMIKVSHIIVHDENNPFGKRPGDYISVSFPSLHDHEIRRDLVDVLKGTIDGLIADTGKNIARVLIVGLGNRNIVSDALGPDVSDELLVTAHLFRQHSDLYRLEGMRDVAVIAPGVMGQTGLESSSIVLAVAKKYHPDLIIALDALATSDLNRVNRVIQISNTGIQPGSGIGNHCQPIDEATMRVPVIAVGVATVTSVGAILFQAAGNDELRMKLEKSLTQENLDLIVTPKTMDEELRYLVQIIAGTLNRVLHPDFERF